MRFFWKLYFSIMIITVICFNTGGYILIRDSFDNSFNSEVERIFQENDIILTSFSHEYINDKNTALYYETDNDELFKLSMLQNMAASMSFESFSGNIAFCLRDNQGKMVYQNGGFAKKTTLVNKISDNQRGYEVKNKGKKYYLDAIRMFNLQGMDLYIENSRDISDLFYQREEQFLTLFYYNLVLLVISGIVIYIIARWLVKPISKLSKATKQIASGMAMEPIDTYSDDEIGQLTKDFNTMTVLLTSTLEELKEALATQEIFMGDFAHELKTPLTSIIGYGDLLRSRRLPEEDIINYADLIVREGKRLEAMSLKLMDLIVLKKQDFKMQWLDAEAFLGHIQEIFAVVLKVSEIDFVCDIGPGKLYGEADLMMTVCFNLLENAKKAILNDGKIILRGYLLDEQYIIEVIDNGVGMNETELSKIKTAFYMVDKSRSRNAGGAGLGLAICDQIVKLHQGTLAFTSVLNQGTVARIRVKGAVNDD